MVTTLQSPETIWCLFARNERKAPASGEVGNRPSFSVVICTDARLEHLKRALSSLEYQTYSNFEVCVVAGPTEDGTRDFLSGLSDRLKVADCDERNLSKSRNIGIALASGEIIAFIDDDAVPEPEWLSQLAQSYDEARVGAVGGRVHDHIGVDYQAQYVTVNRLGRPREEARPTPELNFPGSAQFPHLLGTNCSFRRSALIEIGGFDETYEYFLDETDVCCRINDAGFRIVQRSDAFVHHKYAPSSLRDDQKVVRQWYPLIKNRLYFGLRHRPEGQDVADVVQAGLAERAFWERDVLEKAAAGIFSSDDVERFGREAEAAIEDGLKLSMAEPRLLTDDLIGVHESEFRRFPRRVSDSRGRAILYLDPDKVSVGGDMLAHARQAAAQGQQVYLVVRTHESPSVEFADGVWVHDLGLETRPDSSREDEAMTATVRRIVSRREIDLAYCSVANRDSLKDVMTLISR